LAPSGVLQAAKHLPLPDILHFSTTVVNSFEQIPRIVLERVFDPRSREQTAKPRFKPLVKVFAHGFVKNAERSPVYALPEISIARVT
jgi:hypothetical protein